MEMVEAKYKTGRYVGRLVEVKEEDNRALFQVLAVKRHPNQGDLHQPKQADVQMFHQRKALAYLEKTWVPYSTVKPFSGELEPYDESLLKAWLDAKEKLENEETDWAKQSLLHLIDLASDYQITKDMND